MRMLNVRKKYPEFFAIVEATSLEETNQIDKSGNSMSSVWRRRVAYNTAAVATMELHKYLLRNKSKNKK